MPFFELLLLKRSAQIKKKVYGFIVIVFLSHPIAFLTLTPFFLIFVEFVFEKNCVLW